ncbi:MAG: hypothetical protein GX777_10940 [Fastidiosipila sp.]|nr:hypothetical protein [Fastidiosipila sp.]
MYPVSNEYKDATYAPIRTMKGRVTFDISDVTAAGDVNNIATSQEFILSNKQQLINKNREQTYNLATWEPNRFKLDGSFTFPDDTIENNKEMGYVSNVLCGADGVFDPYQTISFTFNEPHSSMGLTITFDARNNEYASDFTVTAYDANNDVIDTVEVVGNTEVQAVPIGQLYQYKKIEIVIKKWCKPYRRARVVEVDFGVVRVYSDNSLIKMNLIEEMDIMTSTLPSPEFKFTVDNANREFNILNPQGFYKYLQQRQQVIPEIGVVIEGATEFVKLGEYLLWEWISDEGSMTATFTARTVLDLMSSFEYENLAPKTNYSLYDMAEEIFTLCGIENYEIDTELQSIKTLGLVKKTNCKNILQMISIAGMCNVWVTRSNVIMLKQSHTSIDDPVDRIDSDNMYKEPQIELDKVVRAVEVTYYTDLDTRQAVIIDTDIEKGDVLKLENNTTINTEEHAENVANWILSQKTYRAKYSANWRGNPANELNDIITVEDGYGQNKNAIVTKNELTYQGYLTAKTEARGGTS